MRVKLHCLHIISKVINIRSLLYRLLRKPIQYHGSFSTFHLCGSELAETKILTTRHFIRAVLNKANRPNQASLQELILTYNAKALHVTKSIEACDHQ
jgi:hypothetical protein